MWCHWLWFFVPHASVAYVLVRRPEKFVRAAAQMYAVFDIGAVFYWSIPTAPPWYAAAHGRLEDSDPVKIRRMMIEYGEQFWGDLWEPLYDVLGGNPLAAMPSLHFATSLMGAHLLAETDPVAGAVGWSYAITLGLALVYLGEHYLADLIAGAALDGERRAAAPRAAPPPALWRRCWRAGRRLGEGVTGSWPRTAPSRRRHAPGPPLLRPLHRQPAAGEEEMPRVGSRGAGCSRSCCSSSRAWRSCTSSCRSSSASSETWNRLEQGNVWWLALAAFLEVLSFAGYIALFRAVFVRGTSRIGWRESYQITMAGLAATRLFAAAGAGGIALTAWALRALGDAPRVVAAG